MVQYNKTINYSFTSHAVMEEAPEDDSRTQQHEDHSNVTRQEKRNTYLFSSLKLKVLSKCEYYAHSAYFRRQSEEFSPASPPQVLSPPSPRPVRRTSPSPMSNRSGSTTPINLRRKIVVPTEYQDIVPGEFEEKVKQTKTVSQSSPQDSQPQTPLSEYSRKEFTLRPSPKLTRASSKVFEKVRGLEERRRSLDIPEGSISGRSWAGFNRAGSVDSDDGGSRLGISRESSREDLREALKEDAAERRSMFRQRAASLEEKPRYSQKVQDIENKFTEELQRIKKLVGKPHLKKSFSTEQLILKGKQRQPVRKIEPIPPQVLQKLQEREHAQWVKDQRKSIENPVQPHQQNTTSTGSTTITVTRLREVAGTPESMQLSDLPGQRVVRVSPVTETCDQGEELPSRNLPEMMLRRVERRPPSPLVRRVIRAQDSPHGQESSQEEDLSGRKTPIEVLVKKIEHRPESPLVQKRAVFVHELPPQTPLKPDETLEEKMEVELCKPASQLGIPTIIVEDEDMEMDVPVKTNQPPQVTTSTKDRHHPKHKGKNRRSRPKCPELGLN